MSPKTRKQKQEAAAQTPNSDPTQRDTSNSPSKSFLRRQKKREKSQSPKHPPNVAPQASSNISPESQAPVKKQHRNEDLKTMDTNSPQPKFPSMTKINPT
jgi:hypothetical protein